MGRLLCSHRKCQTRVKVVDNDKCTIFQDSIAKGKKGLEYWPILSMLLNTFSPSLTEGADKLERLLSAQVQQLTLQHLYTAKTKYFTRQ